MELTQAQMQELETRYDAIRTGVLETIPFSVANQIKADYLAELAATKNDLTNTDVGDK